MGLTPSELAYAAVFIAVVSMDVSKTSIFSPLRTRIAKISPWAGKLISCPWCFSHWVALVVVLALRVNPVWLFVLVGLAVVPMLLIQLLFIALED